MFKVKVNAIKNIRKNDKIMVSCSNKISWFDLNKDLVYNVSYQMAENLIDF